MKLLLLSFSFLFLSVTLVSAQEYRPSDADSKVTFKVKNFGFNVDGSFKGLEGKIVFDPKDPSKGSIDVSVDAATVNTDNETRDNHLRKEDYFDVKGHPRIRFESTGIRAKNGGYTVTGKLTIKSTTKDISFPFMAGPRGDGFLFSGEFTINRRDFEVGGASTISNNLTVSLSVLGKK